MRTFEFKDGKSNKFWNIELEGKSFTVTYGRIGTNGQTQTKEFADAAKAKTAHDKLVAEKVGKGYVETTGGAVTTSTKSGKALENAILANPDDLAAHAAYADWLSEQGDPRGEFIQVQLALEDPKKPAKERKELQKREQELLKKHEQEWLGSLGPILTANPTVRHPEDYHAGEVPNYQYRFARGFLHTLQITRLTLALARGLRDGPQARLLRELAIDCFTSGGDEEEEEDDEAAETTDDDSDDRIAGADAHDQEYYRPLASLLKIHCWDSLRSFRLGAEIDMDTCLTNAYGTQHHTLLHYCTPLFEHMPKLEELHLLGKCLDVDQLFASRKLPNLRVLRIYHLGVYRAGAREDRRYVYPLETLAKNPGFQNLTHLLFHPHCEEYYHDPAAPDRKGCFLPLTQVRAILQSKHLKRLTHLQLRLSNMGDAGCKEIVESGILKQLKVLDLRHGCISDDGAAILAGSPDLKHLEHLDLSRNGLTAKGIELLKATGVALAASHQQTPRELQEEQYLCDGDSE